MNMQKRVEKELSRFINDPVPGMNIDKNLVEKDISVWFIDVVGASDTLYEGELFRLKFKFPKRYPFESPSVMFTGNRIPIHPHIYSNGHICLSILGEEWSPALSVQSVCLSILSMLSSCKEKVRPPDNDSYIATCKDHSDPKKTRWVFHDDQV